LQGGALFAQDVSPLVEARALSEQAIIKARAGDTETALRLYRSALDLAPEDIAILRDYAVVLGWDDDYPDAIAAIKKLRGLQNDQPVWSVREFARTYLYGDATADALRSYDELVERGDDSEQTLTRRALALRWLGRSGEAQSQYQAVRKRYPDSATAIAGIAFAQSDQEKLSAALRTLDSIPASLRENPEILQARIRILNLMGRHFEAQGVLDDLPGEMQDTRAAMEERIASERWGGRPTEAKMDALKLASLFPGKAADGLWNGIRTDYGQSLSPAFRYSNDSDGLTDRTASLDIGMHVNPANIIRVGYQYRWLEQNQLVRSLVRYDLGWTGTLHRKLVLSATASDVDYRQPGVSRKFVGDASFEVAASDGIRLNAGGGKIVMDAFNAIGNQVAAPFGFGEFAVRFTPGTRLRIRYSRYSFTDNVTRDRADGELTQSILKKSWARVSVGWRSSLMWHDMQTNDFYSPLRFQSHMAVAQSEGRITSWLNYSAEIAGGVQSESNASVLHPFQTSGKLRWSPSRHFRMTAEAARSTSSVDRINPGMRIYSRWAASGGVEIRFP